MEYKIKINKFVRIGFESDEGVFLELSSAGTFRWADMMLITPFLISSLNGNNSKESNRFLSPLTKGKL